MKQRKWIIGTRGSNLALKQTEIVIKKLKNFYPEHIFEVKTIKTKGDTIWDRPLHKIGGKGLFVKEIEEELLKDKIHMAIHSVKDLPVELEDGLILGAVLEREDPRDVFISQTYENIFELKGGATIGTSSLRRKAQLIHLNRDLKVVELRGNVDTRIKKLREKKLDGIILACAGVKRMGFYREIKQILPLDIMVPPAGQGAIGVEIKCHEEMIELLKPINHEKTFKEITIERTLQKKIGGGCHLPLGINASIVEDTVTLHIMLGTERGDLLFKEKFSSHLENIDSMIMDVMKKMPPL